MNSLFALLMPSRMDDGDPAIYLLQYNKYKQGLSKRQRERRIPRPMLGESGANFLYRILNYKPEKCKKLLRLNVHCFRYLVDIMVEKGLCKTDVP